MSELLSDLLRKTNGAEAWRLIHSRYAPDTQNRKHALMQKIMMLANPWCEHTEGFESGLRSWELDVGEWERASGTALADAVKFTVMMNMATILFRNRLQLGTYADSTALRAALLQWCYSSRNLEERIQPCQLEMERAQMMTGCKSTLSSKARRRAKAKTNTRKEIARPARPTRALQTSTRARTAANLDIGRKTAGIPVEERTTIPPSEILAKARVTRKAEGKANTWTLWKRIGLLRQPQPCRILRKIRVLLENSRAFQAWTRGSWV